jgi:hypothetical protein
VSLATDSAASRINDNRLADFGKICIFKLQGSSGRPVSSNLPVAVGALWRLIEKSGMFKGDYSAIRQFDRRFSRRSVAIDDEQSMFIQQVPVKFYAA